MNASTEIIDLASLTEWMDTQQLGSGKTSNARVLSALGGFNVKPE